MSQVLDTLTLKDTNTGKTTEYQIQDKVARAQIAAQVKASTDADANYAAEVVDARVGADGESYDSLGEAIRGQREKSKEEVTQLKEDMNVLYNNDFYFYKTPSSKYNTKDGYYDYNNVFHSNQEWKAYIIEVNSREQFKINFYSYGTDTNKYIITDADDKVLERGNTGETTAKPELLYLTIPKNGRKLIINTKNNTNFSLFSFCLPYAIHGDFTSGSLNEAIKGGTYSVSTTDIQNGNVTDSPSKNGGTLTVLRGFGGNVNHLIQIYFDANSDVFVRILLNDNSVFRTWEKINKDSINNGIYYAFGDSVCRGNHPDASKSDFGWVEYFGKVTNLTTYNKALDGQGYLTTRYQPKAIDTIKATDISNASLITLSFAINDASDSTLTIGNYDDISDNTIVGAAYNCIKYIYDTIPTCQVIVCGSTPQNGTWNERLSELNKNLKLMCEKYNIPFIDLSDCPINSFNGKAGGALTEDGTHYNDTGYKLLSHYMCGKLSTLFR